MPRTHGHQGRLDYPRMIDQRWVDHHIPVARQQLTGHVTIAEKDTPGVLDQATHQRVPVPGAVMYDGLGRLQQIGDDSTVISGGQPVTTRRYELTIEYGFAELRQGLVARFQGVDAQLDGEPLQVVEFHLGTLRWSTVLICEHSAN